jgi:1-acyl-sn-glycerol-3-phosphate acyltransferase
MDFVYAMCVKFILGVHIQFLIKEEVFKPPLGFIFRWLGGIPVERSSSHNLVDQVAKLFDDRENLILALSPEGTRAYVPKWKTGFYYIALKAKVPVVLAYLNFETKTGGIGPTFYPTGDIDKDIRGIMDFYRPIKGKHPELGIR